jgi:hypothetical protein
MKRNDIGDSYVSGARAGPCDAPGISLSRSSVCIAVGDGGAGLPRAVRPPDVPTRRLRVANQGRVGQRRRPPGQDRTPQLCEFQHIGHRTARLLRPVSRTLLPYGQQHDRHFVLGQCELAGHCFGIAAPKVPVRTASSRWRCGYSM